MINVAELRRPPGKEQLELSGFLPTADEVLPVLSDKIVAARMREDIEETWREATRVVRIFGKVWKHRPLFSVSATSEYSRVYEANGWMPIGRVERGRFQELGLQVMREYGYDENEFRVGHSDHSDGTTREQRVYPSKTHKRITFERLTDFYTDTQEPISVHWWVVDREPSLVINLKHLLPRNATVFASGADLPNR